MTLKSTLWFVRRGFEREGMLSVCRIERGDRQVWNPDTGAYEAGEDITVVYAGKCALTGEGRQRIPDVGERELSQGRYALALPWSSPAAHDVRITDTAIIDGRTFDIESVDMADDRKAKYLTVVLRDYA